MTDPSPSGARDVRRAVLRGVKGCCPSCGKTALFGRFLKPVALCPACGQDWSLHSADDLPAYLVVLILGHLLVPIVVAVNLRSDLAMGVQMLLWPGLALILAMLMIQRAKGAVIGFQWARQMQGFSGGR